MTRPGYLLSVLLVSALEGRYRQNMASSSVFTGDPLIDNLLADPKKGHLALRKLVEAHYLAKVADRMLDRLTEVTPKSKRDDRRKPDQAISVAELTQKAERSGWAPTPLKQLEDQFKHRPERKGIVLKVATAGISGLSAMFGTKEIRTLEPTRNQTGSVVGQHEVTHWAPAGSAVLSVAFGALNAKLAFQDQRYLAQYKLASKALDKYVSAESAAQESLKDFGELDATNNRIVVTNYLDHVATRPQEIKSALRQSGITLSGPGVEL